MNRNCNACNIKADNDNYLKDRTVCKSCYNKKKKNNEDLQTLVVREAECQPRSQDLFPQNSRSLIVGPSFSGETHLMLKTSQRPDRDIYIITKSIPEKYYNSKNKIKEIGEEIKSLNEYENAIIARQILNI